MAGKMTKKKQDLNNITFIIMIVSIVFAIFFFYLYINQLSYNTSLEQELNEYDAAYYELGISKITLHNKWGLAYNTMRNCYLNNIPTCDTTIPVRD